MRFGARIVLLPALALDGRRPVAARPGAASTGATSVDVLPALLLIGIGGGLVIPALMTLAMSGVAPEDSGFASRAS